MPQKVLREVGLPDGPPGRTCWRDGRFLPRCCWVGCVLAPRPTPLQLVLIPAWSSCRTRSPSPGPACHPPARGGCLPSSCPHQGMARLWALDLYPPAVLPCTVLCCSLGAHAVLKVWRRACAVVKAPLCARRRADAPGTYLPLRVRQIMRPDTCCTVPGLRSCRAAHANRSTPRRIDALM